MVSFSLRLRISYLLLQDSSLVSFHLIQFGRDGEFLICIASVLSDLHTEKAHVIVKLFAGGELSGFCQEFSKQPGWTHLEVLAHRRQQAFPDCNISSCSI